MSASVSSYFSGCIISDSTPVDSNTGYPAEAWDFSMIWIAPTGTLTPDITNYTHTAKNLPYIVLNLTPLTAYQVWICHIDLLDPAFSFTRLQGPFSVTPNLIEGTIMADEFRGKRFVGSYLIDLGSGAAETKAAAGSESTTTTLNVNNAADFSANGGCAVIFPQDRPYFFGIRYTGVTGNQLTGVSGNMRQIRTGDAVLAVPYAMQPVYAYAGSGVIYTGVDGDSDGLNDTFHFRSAGGSAMCLKFNDGGNTDAFTYTAGHDSGYPAIAGISGLANFSDTGNAKVIVDVTNLPTTASLSITPYSSLTLTGNVEKLPLTGGTIIFAKDGQPEQFIDYTSRSGQVVTLTNNFTPTATGAWTVIPVYSVSCIGTNSAVFVADTNAGVAFMTPKMLQLASIYLRESLTVEGFASILKDLQVGGELIAYGDTTLAGNLTLNGNADFGGALTVAGNANAKNIPKRVVKTSTESVNSSNTGTTLQDDNQLTFPVDASQGYFAIFHLFVTGPDAANFKFAIITPSSPTILRYGMPGDTYETASGTAISVDIGSTTKRMVTIEMELSNVNAGNVTLQWAQGTSNASNTSVAAGSWLEYVKF